MDWYKTSQDRSAFNELSRMGAEIIGDKVKLYRGGNVPKSVLRKLRYNDYLSTVKDGADAYGNEGASSYGKNVIEVVLPIRDIEIVNGEVQYKGKSSSFSGGKNYPVEIYKAYNDYFGSNFTSEQIDKFDPKEVKSAARQALEGGWEEFDELMSSFKNNVY